MLTCLETGLKSKVWNRTISKSTQVFSFSFNVNDLNETRKWMCLQVVYVNKSHTSCKVHLTLLIRHTSLHNCSNVKRYKQRCHCKQFTLNFMGKYETTVYYYLFKHWFIMLFNTFFGGFWIKISRSSSTHIFSMYKFYNYLFVRKLGLNVSVSEKVTPNFHTHVSANSMFFF